MVQRREQEGHPDLRGELHAGRGREVDDHAEGLQHVGGAALGGRGPVAVLDHAGARAAAATIVAIVEMLTVWAPSAPVPTRSTRRPGTLDRGGVIQHGPGQAAPAR